MEDIENVVAAISYVAARFPTRKAAERAAQLGRACLANHPPQGLQIDTVNLFRYDGNRPVDEASPPHVILFTVAFAVNTDDPAPAAANLIANPFLANCEECVSDGEIVELPGELLGMFVRRAISNMAENEAAGHTGPRMVRKTNGEAVRDEPLA